MTKVEDTLNDLSKNNKSIYGDKSTVSCRKQNPLNHQMSSNSNLSSLSITTITDLCQSLFEANERNLRNIENRMTNYHFEGDQSKQINSEMLFENEKTVANTQNHIDSINATPVPNIINSMLKLHKKIAVQNEIDGTNTKTINTTTIPVGSESRNEDCISNSSSSEDYSSLPSLGGTVKKTLHDKDPDSTSLSYTFDTLDETSDLLSAGGTVKKQSKKVYINSTYSSSLLEGSCIANINTPSKEHTSNLSESEAMPDLIKMNKEFMNSPSSAFSASLLVSPEVDRIRRVVLFDEEQNLKSNTKKTCNAEINSSSTTSGKKSRLWKMKFDEYTKRKKDTPTQMRESISMNMSVDETSSFSSHNAEFHISTSFVSDELKQKVSLEAMSEKSYKSLKPKHSLDHMPLTSAWINKHSKVRDKREKAETPYKRHNLSENNRENYLTPIKIQTKNIYPYEVQQISIDDFLSAPAVIQNRVSVDEVNTGIHLINEWVKQHDMNLDDNKVIVSSEDAYEILGESFDDKKCKEILMGLCFWRKIIIRIVQGKKNFIVNY